MRERLKLEEDYSRQTNLIQKMVKRLRLLEQQVQEIQDQHVKNTQVFDILKISNFELLLILTKGIRLILY